MSREPALEVGGCPLTRHRPLARRVTHTHSSFTKSSQVAYGLWCAVRRKSSATRLCGASGWHE
eukprot:5915937-Prymnesium_polylepis.1